MKSWATSTRNHPRLANGLVLLFLTMFVASCGHAPPAATVTIKSVREPLPLAWTNPTPVPACLDQAQLTGDLLACGQQLESNLNSCNRDKASLVTWSTKLPPIVDQVKAPPDPPKRWWQR